MRVGIDGVSHYIYEVVSLYREVLYTVGILYTCIVSIYMEVVLYMISIQ